MARNNFKQQLEARRQAAQGDAASSGASSKPIEEMSEAELEQEIYDLKRQAVEAGREMVADAQRGPQRFLPGRSQRRKRSWK